MRLPRGGFFSYQKKVASSRETTFFVDERRLASNLRLADQVAKRVFAAFQRRSLTGTQMAKMPRVMTDSSQ